MTSNDPANDIMAMVCDNLPEDWEIILLMTAGAAEYSLMNPDGEQVPDEELYLEDMTGTEQLIALVNYAREADGLGPINQED